MSEDEPVVVTYRRRAIRFEPFDHHIERKLRSGRFYEARLLHYIEELEVGGAYVDVGAFVGTHTMFFAAFCPATTVHAFEPRTSGFAMLEKNVAKNGLGERVRLHRLGVSDREEMVSAELDGVKETFACRRLDDVVREPVGLMKIDVEGMEEKVLAGAERILRESKPLLFIEAHTEEALARDLAILAPYGYRPTGRVFNASPTYELAADEARLPATRSLLQPEIWASEDERVEVAWDAGRLRLTSRLAAGESAHVTQQPLHLRKAPAAPLEVSPSSAYFLQTTGEASEGLGVAVFIGEFDEHERIAVDRHYFHPRLFERVEMNADTRRLRIAVRLTGPGEVVFERLALHALPSRDRVMTIDEVRAAHPGLEVRRFERVAAFFDAGLLEEGWSIVRAYRVDDRAQPYAVVLERGGAGGAAERKLRLAELVQLADEETGILRARVDRLDARSRREREEADARLDALETEVATLRAAVEKARDAHHAARLALSDQFARAEALEAQLVDAVRKLKAARGSVSFRVGRATTVALRDAVKHPLGAPRRWIQTFRGEDEVLADLERRGR